MMMIQKVACDTCGITFTNMEDESYTTCAICYDYEIPDFDDEA